MVRVLAIYGLGAGSMFVGLVYSLLPQSGDLETVLAIIERLGVPLVFLVGLLWVLWRGMKELLPFMKDQFITSPRQQLSEEKQERRDSQKRFEEIVDKVSEKHNETILQINDQNNATLNKFSDALKDLTESLERILNR